MTDRTDQASGLPGVSRRHLPYVSQLEHRQRNAVDLVVIHCTELPDLHMAREFGERIQYPGSNTGNCGHFYVDRDGHVEEWVPVDRIAHHAGAYNQRSIGIELVNLGRYPDWFDTRHQELTEPYPKDQISSLIRLLLDLQEAVPTLTRVTGHENLDRGLVVASDDSNSTVCRKRDPGPMFPWKQVLEQISLRFLEI